MDLEEIKAYLIKSIEDLAAKEDEGERFTEGYEQAIIDVVKVIERLPDRNIT